MVPVEDRSGAHAFEGERKALQWRHRPSGGGRWGRHQTGADLIITMQFLLEAVRSQLGHAREEFCIERSRLLCGDLTVVVEGEVLELRQRRQ